MRRIFVDNNIVMDLLEKRNDFYIDAQKLFSLADEKKVELYVSALSIANIHYLLNKYLKLEARKNILRLKILLKILPLDDDILELALASDFKDFEDAIQYYTALENGMDAIITRNKKDFTTSLLSVLTAKEFLTKQNF